MEYKIRIAPKTEWSRTDQVIVTMLGGDTVMVGTYFTFEEAKKFAFELLEAVRLAEQKGVNHGNRF